jgi:hypothetical protein
MSTRLETQCEDESVIKTAVPVSDIVERVLDSQDIAMILAGLIQGNYTQARLYSDLMLLTLDTELQIEKESKE